MQILASPFNLPASVGRMFAMHTSKIPRWPDWIYLLSEHQMRNAVFSSYWIVQASHQFRRSMHSPEFGRKRTINTSRPLDMKEREGELKIKKRLENFEQNAEPHQGSVIQLNSTFIEVNDPNYIKRGLYTCCYLFSALMCFALYLFAMVFDPHPETTILESIGEEGLFVVGVVIMLPIMAMLATNELLKESFSYTHFPVRLNRKNRKIYIWQGDGKVLRVEWDKVFFRVRSYTRDSSEIWDIACHIMDDDRVTVKGTFGLGYMLRNENELRQHWEYFRRYMEDGPEQPYRMLRSCLPIAERRETWREGFRQLSSDWFSDPFFLPLSLGRVFAMRTSKIPRWPDWVEHECAIASDDPYVRESGFEAKAA